MNEVKQLNETKLQKQESMMIVGKILDDTLDVTKQQGKSSSPRNDMYVEGAKALQVKNKDLENIVCKTGKLTETLQLLTNEQRVYQDTIHKSGLGYKGPYVLSQANAKISKLYSAYELLDENVQLHVFDSEKTLDDAKKSRLKMKQFQKDEKVQELKIKSIDYTKLNDLYETFVQQVELLFNKMAKFEAYFEKLENTKVVLERQLARKVDDSKAEKDQSLKEINHLRVRLKSLKGKSRETKFDKHLILRKPHADKLLITSQLSKSWFTPKVVQKDLPKPVTT
nr:hypothetical protein [Tanacetum cinerariifolium]